ncbi:MAG: hypothetical protein ACPGVL_02840 [Pseudoalteromonas spongiae]
MTRITQILIILSTVISLSFTAKLSHAEQVSLNTIADLTGIGDEQAIALSPINQNAEQYLLLTKQGKVKRISNGIVEPAIVLDLASVIPSAIKTTALALHPNFTIRDQRGFATIYTAHIEPLNTQRKYSRLQDDKAPSSFDVIINEWQIDDSKTVDIATKREVIRIAVPSEQTTINQLAFSPFTKVWNDDFGFLYIALNHDKDYAAIPLYSGTILRINPARFGLRNFTTPIDNPFVKSQTINDEILLLGLQQVNQFIWPQKDNAQLLVSHVYNNEQLLTLAKPKNDWRNNAPTDVIHRQQSNINYGQLIAYRGKLLANLWGSLLFINEENNQRQLMTMPIPSISQQPPPPTALTNFDRHSDADNAQLMLFQNNRGEMVLLDNAKLELNKIIDSLGADNPTAPSNETATNPLIEGVSDDELFNWFILILLAVIAYFVYQKNKKKRLSAKFIVRQQFSRFELSESGKQISLFNRHQKVASEVITVDELAVSQVQLNKMVISTIDDSNGFNDDKETDLREHFNKERRDKMVPDKVRQINIEFTGKNGTSYPICLYLRKGDNRITRKRYQDAIDEVIDWSWHFSAHIAPNQTGKRKPVTPKPIPDADKPIYKPNKVQAKAPATQAKKPVIKVSSNGKAQTSVPSTPNSQVPTAADAKLDADLINALEKLVRFKEQGILSAEEFEQAKTKLLKKLV